MRELYRTDYDSARTGYSGLGRWTNDSASGLGSNGAIAQGVKVSSAKSAVGASIPARAKVVEIYFSPFNVGDCVSLMARMTT